MSRKEFKARVKYSNINVDTDRLYDIIISTILQPKEGEDDYEKCYTNAC